jgi:multidrug efflux pump subunit AcrA (membrane-fusion protein)
MNVPPRSLWILLPLCTALLTASGCGKASDNVVEPAAGLMVRAQPAATRTFERRLKVQGSLEAKNTAQVAARTPGNLETLWVDEGDDVVAGETALFQVDPSRNQEALVIARQDMEVARASLAVAKASEEKTQAEARKVELDFERYTRLHKEGKVTDNEFETREVAQEQAKAGLDVAAAQVNLAERQVKQAEAGVAIARKNLDDTKVIAPISGVITARLSEPGEEMSVGHAILRIEDLSVVEVSAYLPAQYYPEIIPGQTEFHLTVGGQDAGSVPVTYRSPVINPVLRTFEIKGTVSRGSDLTVPGSMADLTVVFESRNGLAAPSSSILTRNQQQVVFVVQDGKAVSTPVQTGLQNDGWTEILSGLENGAVIVTEGQTLLHDNVPVQVL